MFVFEFYTYNCCTIKSSIIGELKNGNFMKVNSVMTQPNFTAKVKNKSLLIILVVPNNLQWYNVCNLTHRTRLNLL